jgi:hypothetical protein
VVLKSVKSVSSVVSLAPSLSVGLNNSKSPQKFSFFSFLHLHTPCLLFTFLVEAQRKETKNKRRAAGCSLTSSYWSKKTTGQTGAVTIIF